MILVTGATGKVGREVVNLLLDEGEAGRVHNPGPSSAAVEQVVGRCALTFAQ